MLNMECRILNIECGIWNIAKMLFILVFLFSPYSIFPIPYSHSGIAFASDLQAVSDVISDSRLSGATTTHSITFTVTTVVPQSGSISITPQSSGGGAFNIPGSLDFTDVDLAVSVGGGAFVDRTLAAIPTATDDGVSVTSGGAGNVSITLASGGAVIPAGATVRVNIGSNATYGATGDQFIQSPSLQSSYRIRIYTRDVLGATIDGGTAMIAVIPPVTLSANSGNINPAVRSNGLPTGLLPGTTVNVWASLNTDIPAMCKYATTSGVDFYTMSSSTIFTQANSDLLHYQLVPTATNTVYNLYVRCMTTESRVLNPDDYLINFQVGVVPNASSTPTPPAPPPPPPSPSGPSGGGGGGGLFLPGGEVTLDGRSFPSGVLVITKDGVVVKEEPPSSLGNFHFNFPQLGRGTYNWGVSVRDPKGNKSSTYTSTIYLIGRTNNIIAPIYLSPTISAASSTVALGGSVVLQGYAIPLTPVQGLMNKQGDVLNAKIVSATTTAAGNGSWTLTLPTADLPKGTYEIKAQSLISSKEHSLLSPTLYVGVGESANPNFSNRADLNKDNKVNLVDFSILLFNWKGTDAVADINQDRVVNLTDFSIMLSNWTG